MDRIAFLSSLASGGAALRSAVAAACRHASDPRRRGDAIVLKPLSLIKKADMDFGDLDHVGDGGDCDDRSRCTGAVTTCRAELRRRRRHVRGGICRRRIEERPYQIRLSEGADHPDPRRRHGDDDGLATGRLDGRPTGSVGANQAFQFGVGGQLSVAANQADGTYVGTFDVTVHYP